jgi:hypothetical protein
LETALAKLVGALAVYALVTVVAVRVVFPKVLAGVAK